jgi:hypothetical protein
MFALWLFTLSHKQTSLMYRRYSQQEQCVPVQAWWMSPSEQPCCRSVYMYSIYTTPQPLHSMLQDMCLENITCSNSRQSQMQQQQNTALRQNWITYMQHFHVSQLWKRRRNQFCDHVVRRSMASRGYCVAGPVCLLLKTHSAAAHCKQQKKVRSPLPAKSTNCAVSSKLGDFPAVIISKITLIIYVRVFAFRLPYPSFSFFKTSACMHSRYLRVGGWT